MGMEKTGFTACDPELHEFGHVGRATRRERDMHEDGKLDTRKLEKIEEGMQILEGRWRKHDGMTVDVHVYSAWAIGPVRKSTSGGMMMINGTVVTHRSNTQASRALSTAGSLGMQSMMTDVGLGARDRVWTDSNAAKAIASRRGLGKTRHRFENICGCRR